MPSDSQLPGERWRSDPEAPGHGVGGGSAQALRPLRARPVPPPHQAPRVPPPPPPHAAGIQAPPCRAHRTG